MGPFHATIDQAMPGIDKPAGRVAIVLVLVVVAATALRGYLPGAQRAARQPPANSTASLVAVVALSAVALAILAFAVITRRPPTPSSAQYGPAALRGIGGELRARWVLIAVGAVLAWLLAVVLIVRLGTPPGADRPVPAQSPPADRPGSPAPDTAPPEPPDPTGASDGTLRYLAVVTVVLMVILVVGFIVQVSHRQPAGLPTDSDAYEPAPARRGPETLARAAELGLVEIGDASRDPRAAIIACYAAMERGLAHAPGAMPLASDTPSEVLARAVDHHAVSGAGATELVELFTEARFSPHVMTEAHRDSAVAALRQVLADLRSVP